MNDKIREAVKHFNLYGFIPPDMQEDVIKIASDYLKCSGEMPKEKELFKDKRTGLSTKDYIMGGVYELDNEAKNYNQALHDCTLVFMKKAEVGEMSQITTSLVEKNFPKNKCKERGAALLLYAEMLIILHNHWTGEGER